jgi:hypothetical protein
VPSQPSSTAYKSRPVSATSSTALHLSVLATGCYTSLSPRCGAVHTSAWRIFSRKPLSRFYTLVKPYRTKQGSRDVTNKIIDLALALAQRHWATLEIDSFDMRCAEHVEFQQVWRSLVFGRAWLQSTIGACTTDALLWLPPLVSISASSSQGVVQPADRSPRTPQQKKRARSAPKHRSYYSSPSRYRASR